MSRQNRHRRRRLTPNWHQESQTWLGLNCGGTAPACYVARLENGLFESTYTATLNVDGGRDLNCQQQANAGFQKRNSSNYAMAISQQIMAKGAHLNKAALDRARLAPMRLGLAPCRQRA